MLRASALVEGLGVPSVSLTCEGFLGQAVNTSAGLGMPNLPVALVPGHVDVQTAEELLLDGLILDDRLLDKILRAGRPVHL